MSLALVPPYYTYPLLLVVLRMHAIAQKPSASAASASAIQLIALTPLTRSASPLMSPLNARSPSSACALALWSVWASRASTKERDTTPALWASPHRLRCPAFPRATRCRMIRTTLLPLRTMTIVLPPTLTVSRVSSAESLRP